MTNLDLSQLPDDTRCALIIGSGDLTIGDLRAALGGSPLAKTPGWVQEKLDQYDIPRESVPWDLVQKLERDPGLTEDEMWTALEIQMTKDMWVRICTENYTGAHCWERSGNG